MDSFEINKIVAAVLVTMLLIFGLKELAHMIYHQESHEQSTYLAKEIETPSLETVASVDVEEEISINELLIMATLQDGQKTFKKCSQCHVATEGGANKIGPVLWDVVNRKIGSVNEFNYSNVMSNFGGIWDYETLNLFLKAPKKYMAGTKMGFAGLKKPKDRANVILYLRSLSNEPAALPDN